MSGPDVSVELLGPVRLLRGADVVDAGGPKQLAVLATLALRAGRAVPAADLTAAVWGDTPPASAATTLRAYVSRLRALLPEGLLERSGAGWELGVPRAHVDALLAEDLLAGAPDRPTTERALALWRGDPLAGLDPLPVSTRERPRLDDLRARGQERLVAHLMADGHAREAVPLAASLVASYPHRESAACQLAVVLARAGRHADALTALDDLRRRLADDLGLDVSPQTAEVHKRLLLHDPSLLVAPLPTATPTPATAATATTATTTARDPATPATPAAAPASGEAAATGEPGPGGPRLPVPLTSFVGREGDITTVHDALDRHRLVTLVGPGGCGKTRLALEALRRRPDAAVDGPWLVELGWVQPGQVVDAVASALQLAGTAVDAAAVADAVRGRRLLLLLDNCEHVVAETAALVEHLLAECGGLQVLATSRETLGVPGEHRQVVQPLPTGRPGRPGEAERLFVDRARSVVPSFEVDPATAAGVARLVRALDGIPLALELAAARLAVMGLDDMVGMLDDRFAVLDGGSRTALPHQRTLAAAVEWSHGLLEDDERTLFAVASTFSGPFELAALRGLAEPELDRPVIGLLAGLTAKSMVQVDGAADLRSSRSYRLLETLRVFGRSVTGPALAERLARRHAEWFAADADEAFTGLRGPDLARWLQHLDLVRPDMRAALAWSVEHGERDLAMRLAAGLGMYWFHRGHVAEGRTWTMAALELPGPSDPVLEARLGLGSALLAYAGGFAAGNEHGDVDRTVRAAQSTAAEPGVVAVASVYAGFFLAAFGELPAATVHFERAGALVASGQVEPWAVAEVLFAQGQLLRVQGEHLQALHVFAESARVGHACGHVWAGDSGRYLAAKVHVDLRQGAPALHLLAQVLPSNMTLGFHTSTLACLHVAAAAVALLERHAEAAELLGAVDATGERLGYSPARMDPVDGTVHRALVREALDEAGYRAAYERGRRVGMAQAVEQVLRLSRETARRPVRAQA